MREHTQEQLIKEIMWENHQIEEDIRKYPYLKLAITHSHYSPTSPH